MELDKVSAEGGVTLKQSEYDPNDYLAIDKHGDPVGARYRIRIEETAPGKFTGSYKWRASDVTEKVTSDTRQGVIDKLKAIHSEVDGKVTFHIPGDGTFTVMRNGRSLSQLLQRAKQIDVRTTPIKPEANLIRKGQNQGSSAEDIYATQLATTLGKDAAIADQEAQLKQVKPSSDAAKSIRKTIEILKKTDYAEPTPQAATQAGTPNFQATPAQLGVASPLPEFLNAAAQTVTTGQGALKMGRLAQAIKETVRGAMNHTFPKLTNADRLSGELAARWVSSRAAAKYLAKVFSAKVVEGLNVDPAKFGAALTEDNLRSVRAGWQAAGDDVQAAQVKTLIGGPKSPFKTEAEYQAFLNEPAVKTAIERHKALWDQVIEPMYRKAMQIDDSVELPSRGLQTGARVNLFSPKDEPGAPQRNMVQGVGQGNLTGTMRRKSPFGQQATGAGRTYNTNYHDMMANTYGRQLEVANKNAFENQLVDSGHAVIANVGERPTLPDGEETTSFPAQTYRHCDQRTRKASRARCRSTATSTSANGSRASIARRLTWTCCRCPGWQRNSLAGLIMRPWQVLQTPPFTLKTSQARFLPGHRSPAARSPTRSFQLSGALMSRSRSSKPWSKASRITMSNYRNWPRSARCVPNFRQGIPARK